MAKAYPWSRVAADLATASGANFDALAEQLLAGHTDSINEDQKWQDDQRVQGEAFTRMATELLEDIYRHKVVCRDSKGKPFRGDPKTLPLSGPNAPHLTREEGNAWLKSRGYLERWDPNGETAGAESIKVEPRAIQQERLVLEAIKESGYDPKKIPVHKGGKGGLKSNVKRQLVNDHHTMTDKAFNKTWERLRRNNDIEDA